MKNNKEKLIEIIEVLLMAFIELDKETSKFVEILEENEIFMKFYPSLNVEIFPVNELVKVLKIKDENKDEFVDRALKLSEEKANVKNDVKKFMNDYIL